MRTWLALVFGLALSPSLAEAATTVRRGIKEILLENAGLYEGLRAKAGGR